MLKAIETIYRGNKYRSRLEARWAVFFDNLGIKYEYEQEGYILSNGSKYLPDFFLPTFCYHGMYVEVKPECGDFSKAIQFAKEAQKEIWLAEGTPAIRAYNVFCALPYEGELFEPYIYAGIPNADQAEGDNRMFGCPGYENKDLSIPEEYISCLGNTFIVAVQAARFARFEHGETPLVRS